MPCVPPEPRTALKESERESKGLNVSAAWDVGSLVGGLWGPQRLSGLGGQSPIHSELALAEGTKTN